MTNSSGLRRFLSSRVGCLTVAVVMLGFTVFVAAFVDWLVLGEGVWRGEVRVVEAALCSPDRLTLFVASCNGDPEVSLLRETDVDVQVKVVASSTSLRGGNDCLDIVDIQLQQPLGGRVVVDKHTGQSVSFRSGYCPDN